MTPPKNASSPPARCWGIWSRSPAASRRATPWRPATWRSSPTAHASPRKSRFIMQWLAALCVRRPGFASGLVLSLSVVGVFAFMQLGIDQFPNVDIPTALVTTRLPGAAPEQVESEVTDKIEEEVKTISGIDTPTSTSSEGVSQVVVAFTLETNA